MNKISVVLVVFGLILGGCCSEDFIIPDEGSGGPTQFNVFVSLADADNISIIDPIERVEIEEMNPGSDLDISFSEPRNLAISPNGLMVYVPFRFTNNVLVIDPETLTAEEEISDASFDEPYAIAFTANNSEAWVVNKQGGGSTTGSISIINTATREVVDVIDHISISSPEGIAIANGKAYVANRGDGTVSVFNVSNRNFITTIDNGESSGNRYAVATPNGDFVYVSADNDGVWKIRTSDNTIDIVLPIFGRNMTVSPDGSRLYVASQSNVIYTADVATDDTSITITIPGANSLYGVAISGDEGYASDESNNTIYLFNATTNQPIDTQISVGFTPRAIVAQ
jgi:YVTN family beta-propeller protein